jgi:hypothetical protein
MRAQEFLTEAFDRPYPLNGWKETEYGDVDASAQLPDGGHLLIMFNSEQNDDGEETVIIRFDRNGSEEITGGGDAQRIFATVLSAIHEYIKDYQPLRINFSASKDVDVGQNVDSRFKLYDRMILRYAKSWGYRFFRVDNSQAVIYELSRLKQGVAEGSLNEFSMGDDGEDPTDNYPCYDCGSTIFLHHTKLCDLAEDNAIRDLPAKPGSQHWTGQIPKGLNPIPGLQEGVAEGFSNDMSTEDMIEYLKQHHDKNLHSDYLNHLTNTNSKFVLKNIPLTSIRTELSGLDRAKVEQYKKMDFSKAPPIVIGSDGNILDGYHRANVAKALGIPTIKAYVGIKGQQGVAENFDDGKKPGRKGLAKRVGVNCKQPVAKLRSIAANSSGERQRMAHWCANMKSGKKSLSESGRLDVDVKNESWLQEKIDYAKSKGRNSYGVPYFGSTTASVRGTPPKVRVMRLASLPGMRNEQTNVRKNDLKWLMDYMEKTGKLPPSHNPDKEYLPYIMVAYNGEAWVNEGNHRIMAAYRLNWQTMPIEIRYFDGGERIQSGPMYPGKIGLQ